ncbi:protein-disulfide isomerase [Leucobacter exalbidus]|uniref:Protein-disulfide isomerase n=1 Tax=Leucobacter exalbidus TaxID=662960 RepID=A0A940PQP3_9MICO|nr:thioredoxin domain-containing protein [Leucobacter exalbidus]MBP1327563.1 protein-disulfide isomerase [Leucobacter exalbidus]
MTSAPEVLPRHILERRLRSARLWNVMLAVIAALALVFGGVMWSQNSSGNQAAVAVAVAVADGAGNAAPEATTPELTGEVDGAAAEQPATGAAPVVERRIEGDPMAIGDIDAPVVLSEWVDLRCPYCAVYTRDTLPDVVKEYVDSGKVRIEMHDVAFFGEESLRASTAARAAAEQGKYFEFLDAVYEAAPESGHPELTTKELIGHARTAGVPNIELFTSDMEREDLRAEVTQMTTEASELGVTGVPFFAVDGQAFSGAQPIDYFREFLDSMVAEK